MMGRQFFYEKFVSSVFLDRGGTKLIRVLFMVNHLWSDQKLLLGLLTQTCPKLGGVGPV